MDFKRIVDTYQTAYWNKNKGIDTLKKLKGGFLTQKICLKINKDKLNPKQNKGYQILNSLIPKIK